MNKAVLLMFFTMLFLNPLLSQTEETYLNIDELEKFITETTHVYNIPGLSVTVVNDNRILYNGNIGKDDKGCLISSDTPYFLGSTSKTFTALAVMQLVEKGIIDLDIPVRKYLPDFIIANKEYNAHITVRHLLNHTSGLSGKDLNSSSLGMESLEEEMMILKDCNPNYPHGTHYEYFNSNYRLLGLLIEKVSGIPFHKFLDEEIFRPLGMHHTTAILTDNIEAVGGHGQLFGLPVKRNQVYRRGAVPSGYIISTTSDVSKFLIDELKSVKGMNSYLPKKIVLQTWENPNKMDEGYVMGWVSVKDSIANNFVVHGGSLENYQSFFYLNPNKNIGFVILMNQGGLLPMMTFNVVRDGIISIINQKEPDLGAKNTPVIVAMGFLLLVVGICIFRINRVIKKPKFGISRKISIMVDFAVVIFILFGFIPLMNRIMEDKADWSMLWSMLPEFCLSLFIICICSIISGCIKMKQLIQIK